MRLFISPNVRNGSRLCENSEGRSEAHEFRGIQPRRAEKSGIIYDRLNATDCRLEFSHTLGRVQSSPANRRSEAKRQDLNRRSFGSGTERRPEAPAKSLIARAEGCLLSEDQAVTFGFFRRRQRSDNSVTGSSLPLRPDMAWRPASTRSGEGRPTKLDGDATIFRFGALQKIRICATLSR